MLTGPGLLTAEAAGNGGRKSALRSHGRHGKRVAFKFPKKFLWGAGTSGLQHEGYPLAKGAGQSVMYRWAHTPGKTSATFDVSADFFHRYREDIKLMKKMGLEAYNFEVYWPRVLPDGVGRVNRRGLDFYDRLVDEFLDAGIKPLCNLYVFDHPVALEDNGGWQNRDMAEAFAEYGAVLFDRLGDRVPLWTTVVETLFINHVCNFIGGFPPENTDLTKTLRALHHMLLGEGLAVQAFRASDARGDIGNQHLVLPIVPASDSEADIGAAERANAYFNRLALDPQRKGEYPQILIDHWGSQWPADAIHGGDLGVISTPMDFLGLDYYFGLTITHDPAFPPVGFNPDLQIRPVGRGTTTDPWTPDGPPTSLRDALVWLRDNYGDIPMHLLELGTSVTDTPEQIGHRKRRVQDPERLRYIRNVLTAAHEAISEGVDLRSCFIWSFLDGWEFGSGLDARYGLVYVDYENNQKRIVKSSGKWYADTIKANGFDVPDESATAPLAARGRMAHAGIA